MTIRRLLGKDSLYNMDPSGFNDTDNTQSPKYIPLSYWNCFYVNSANGTFRTLKDNTFYKCNLQMRYALDSECTIGGNSVPCGYWICVAVTAVVVLFANFGIFSNILNLLILPKSLNGCSVKRLMVMLAIFDLIASVCAIPVSLLMLLILGRYENRYEALQAFRILQILFSLGRTGSIFTTIMIAIERYIAIAFPLKQLLTSKKTRLHLIILFIIIFLLNLPWWLNKTVERNDVYWEHERIRTRDGGSHHVSGRKLNTSSWNDLSEFPYIYKGTAFSRNIYPKIVTFHIFADFAFPFPMLLIFNGLLYRSIYLSNKARQTLTISQRREVNAAKMFSIVAFILLLCHTVAVAIFVCTQMRRELFRELQFFQMLATTLNAAINFMVYYLFGKSFRDEFWVLIHSCKVYGRKVEMVTAMNPAATHSSQSNGSVELGVTALTKYRSTINHQQPQQQQQV